MRRLTALVLTLAIPACAPYQPPPAAVTVWAPPPAAIVQAPISYPAAPSYFPPPPPVPATAPVPPMASSLAPPAQRRRANGAVHTCFVPGGDCTGAIVDAIDLARAEILVQAYAFTSWRIADALMAAHRRGVDVRAIMDRRRAYARRSQAGLLRAAGIPVLLDSVRGLAHNKVILVDARTVITGSFNFTNAAQMRNAENVLTIDDPAVAAAYRENWERRAAVSTLYVPLPYGDAPSLAWGWLP